MGSFYVHDFQTRSLHGTLYLQKLNEQLKFNRHFQVYMFKDITTIFESPSHFLTPNFSIPSDSPFMISYEDDFSSLLIPTSWHLASFQQGVANMGLGRKQPINPYGEWSYDSEHSSSPFSTKKRTKHRTFRDLNIQEMSKAERGSQGVRQRSHPSW